MALVAMDRVLEIGGFAAGYCGRMFVQAGCEVVHVAGASLAPSEHSSAALDAYLHAGKRRIQTDDLTIIGELAGRADIVIAEAPTAQGLLDLGFDDWRTPVKAAITPFGRTGPKKNWSATPSTLLAMAGYTYLMGRSGPGAADPAGPLCGIPERWFRLPRRERESTGRRRKRHRRGDVRIGYGVEPVYDGVVDLRGRDTFPPRQTTSFTHRQATCIAVRTVGSISTSPCISGTPLPRPLIGRSSCSIRASRRMPTAWPIERRCTEILAEAFGPLSTAEVLARATEHRFPCGELKTFDEVLHDPHLAQRDFWQQVDGAHGRVSSPRIGWRMDGASPRPAVLSEREQRSG